MACHVIPNYTIASCRPLELEPSPRRRSGRCQVWFTCAEEFHPRKGDWMEHDPVHTTEILACLSRLCSPASWVTLMLQRLLFLNIKFSPLTCWNFDDTSDNMDFFCLCSLSRVCLVGIDCVEVLTRAMSSFVPIPWVVSKRSLSRIFLVGVFFVCVSLG